MRKVILIKCNDAMFDPGKLSAGTKMLLYPIFIKVFGLLKATILLFGR